jgi:hypothetical protein
MTPTNAALAARRTLEPTHPCVRCGREGVPMDAGLCELCNPLDLSQPSATQMHGIAALGILAFIAVLAVAGRLTQVGTGPFQGQVGSVVASGEGLSVTLSVRNDGTNASATTCTVAPVNPGVGDTPQVIQIPMVPPGKTIQFTTTVTRFGPTPVDLLADCSAR